MTRERSTHSTRQSSSRVVQAPAPARRALALPGLRRARRRCALLLEVLHELDIVQRIIGVVGHGCYGSS